MLRADLQQGDSAAQREGPAGEGAASRTTKRKLATARERRRATKRKCET